jgi:hypothetical protein
MGVCINQGGVEGCVPPPALSRARAKGKIKGVWGSAGVIHLDPPQLLEGSACGALLDIVTPIDNLKGYGKARLDLHAVAPGNEAKGIEKRVDRDKLTFWCTRRPGTEACPSPPDPSVSP